MSEPNQPMVSVPLPQELFARMDEIRKSRERDRGRSVEDLIRGFCESYIRARAAVVDERSRMDELNRSYEERPYDEWDEEDRDGRRHKEAS